MPFDPDFGKGGFARRLFRLRFRRLRVSQDVFARRYGLSAGMVRDVEQGRHAPSRALRSLIALIENDPTQAAQIIGASLTAKDDER